MQPLRLAAGLEQVVPPPAPLKFESAFRIRLGQHEFINKLPHSSFANAERAPQLPPRYYFHRHSPFEVCLHIVPSASPGLSTATADGNGAPVFALPNFKRPFRNR